MTNKLVVIINSLKVPKIKKILLYEMKFLVQNYSCLQNPWLEGYRPQFPVLSVLNWICWSPPLPDQNSWVRHWTWGLLRVCAACQTPLLIWSSSSVPPGTISTIPSPPGPRRIEHANSTALWRWHVTHEIFFWPLSIVWFLTFRHRASCI